MIEFKKILVKIAPYAIIVALMVTRFVFYDEIDSAINRVKYRSVREKASEYLAETYSDDTFSIVKASKRTDPYLVYRISCISDNSDERFEVLIDKDDNVTDERLERRIDRILRQKMIEGIAKYPELHISTTGPYGAEEIAKEMRGDIDYNNFDVTCSLEKIMATHAFQNVTIVVDVLVPQSYDKIPKENAILVSNFCNDLISAGTGVYKVKLGGATRSGNSWYTYPDTPSVSIDLENETYISPDYIESLCSQE